MSEPRVPGGRGPELSLPCGETVRARDLDMGQREYDCACGDRHAVVMDVHPPSRFLPAAVVDVLRESVEPADGSPEFGTRHLMGMVVEEFPERVASADASEDGRVGFALIWIADFDARRLHEVVVELVVELMEHAVSHSEGDVATEFEQQMLQFDVGEFVERYRAQRDFDDEFDRPV